MENRPDKQKTESGRFRKDQAPFDSVFKTESIYNTRLLIPVLKEMFPELKELSEAKPEILGHEHPAEKDAEKPVPKRSADCVLRIGNRIFHLEVQSTDDGTILFRLVEYDLRIAMEQAEYNRKEKSLTIELPLSGLL